ncbi:hypothetical protein [Paraburkholderia youngii]|uniref:hypothetical protein n=1 Tax=Paraburkholderia youngii TaxID=2782701 RepID=UPI003D1DF23A
MKTATRPTRDRIDDVDRMLDEALEETFPASDPVACTAMPSISSSVALSHRPVQTVKTLPRANRTARDPKTYVDRSCEQDHETHAFA